MMIFRSIPASLLATSLVAATPGFAEDSDTERAVMIEAPKRHFMVAPYLEIPSVDIDVSADRDETDSDNESSYSPNTGMHLGLKGTFEDFAFSWSVGLPTGAEENLSKGRTRYHDLSLSYHQRRYGVRARYQRYRGFYLNDDDRATKKRNSDGDEIEIYPQRPDLKVQNYELNGIYVFSPERFSLQAAADFDEFQRASGGSALAMLSLQQLVIRADEPLVSAPAGVMLTAPETLTEVEAFSLTPMAGYGHAFIKDEVYFFTMAGGVGPSIERRRARRSDGSSRVETGLGTKVMVDVSLGYNGERALYGVKSSIVTNQSTLRQADVSYTSILVTIFAGLRFDDWRTFYH